MTTRKWIGLGESEYVSRDGEFLVQLQGRTWHLFRRVSIEIEGLPSWTWSASLFNAKRKGACQQAADDAPEAEAPARIPTVAVEEHEEHEGDHEPRGALTHYGHDAAPGKNASCWCCGVSFVKPKNWQYGDLCGSHCMDLMVDVLSDVEALK